MIIKWLLTSQKEILAGMVGLITGEHTPVTKPSCQKDDSELDLPLELTSKSQQTQETEEPGEHHRHWSAVVSSLRKSAVHSKYGPRTGGWWSSLDIFWSVMR